MKDIKRHITRGSSIFIYCKKRLQEKITEWNKYFRNGEIDVVPYYAMKCNPKEFIIRDLIEGGIRNFDCASINEIKIVNKFLNLTNNNNNNNKEEDKIIFAQPCKEVGHIQKSMTFGVNLYTFDCVEELEKINKYNSKARVVLRLAVDDSNSICQFSKKYGIKPEKDNIDRILGEMSKMKKKNNKIDFAGVSFHVGSGCLSAYQYVNAIKDCYNVLEIAEKKYKYKPKIIDIGGGFNNTYPIQEISEKVIETVNKLNIRDKYRYIAEPGRYLVENCADLYTKINTVKYDRINRLCNIYITNGTYQDLNCVIYDHIKPDIILYDMNKNIELHTIKCINKQENENNENKENKKNNKIKMNVWGPTCDSMDKVGEYYIEEEYIEMMKDENIIIKFKNMGAYTMAAGCSFNGYDKARIVL